MRTLNEKLLIFLNGRLFCLLFSAIYSIINTFSFYPGILYSDSHYRWSMAEYFEKFGWLGEIPLENHHPVVPAMVMSFFYSVSNEVGLYIIIQCFAFLMAVFYLSRKIKPGLATNLIVSFFLLFTVNEVYSIFHSFDVTTGIALAFFAGKLIEFIKGNEKALYALPILFFVAVAWRLNAFAILPFVLLPIIVILYKRKYKLIKIGVFSFAFVFSAYAPFLITSSLKLKEANSWVVGVAFEYPNMATKSENSVHRTFIEGMGLSFDDLKNSSYQTERIGNSFYLLEKVKYDSVLSQQLKEHYIQIFKEEPLLFIQEKLKFISYKLGIPEDIANTEIGKWRENKIDTDDSFWEKTFKEEYNFYTDEFKEAKIDRFYFLSEIFRILFKPYLVFLISGLLICLTYFLFNKQEAIHLLIVWLIALLYYSTFFILSGDTIFRYFFPSIYLLQVIFILFLSSTINWISVKLRNLNSLLVTILVILVIYQYVDYRKYEFRSSEVDSFETRASLIAEDKNFKVFKVANELIYVCKKPEMVNYSANFFLHLTPVNVEDLPEERQQYGFDNLDFRYVPYEYKFPWYSDKKDWIIIQLQLPDYQVKSLSTGQYTAEERIWEASLMPIEN